MVKKIVLLGLMVGAGTTVVSEFVSKETELWLTVEKHMNWVGKFSNDEKLKKALQDALNVFRASLARNNDSLKNLWISDLSPDQTVLGTSGKKGLDNPLVSAISTAIENIRKDILNRRCAVAAFEKHCKSLDNALRVWYRQRVFFIIDLYISTRNKRKAING